MKKVFTAQTVGGIINMASCNQYNVTNYTKELFGKEIIRDPNMTVFTIDNVFSKEECDKLIKVTEDRGYEKALVNVGFGMQKYIPDVRKSDRCIIDDPEMAADFWRRIKDYIPKEIKTMGKTFEAVGINERMRFLRYDKGHYFAPHYDGSYVRPDGEELSLITFFLYLNDGFKGGASTFINPEKNKVIVPCPPKTGRLLIFEHKINHEGSILKKGRKYALRTDIMYKTKKEI